VLYVDGMARTYHEYDFPRDKTVHWHALRAELREGATTTEAEPSVTCPGCKAWLADQETAAARRPRTN
jgi:hypothetical protein